MAIDGFFLHFFGLVLGRRSVLFSQTGCVFFIEGWRDVRSILMGIVSLNMDYNGVSMKYVWYIDI